MSGLSEDRRELLLALALADGQPWHDWTYTNEHTAEMMYGKQAEAIEAIVAARVKAAKVEALREAADAVVKQAVPAWLRARADRIEEDR